MASSDEPLPRPNPPFAATTSSSQRGSLATLTDEEPLQPPNPNRFSMRNSSVVLDSPRDSVLSQANSEQPINAPTADAGASSGPYSDPYYNEKPQELFQTPSGGNSAMGDAPAEDGKPELTVGGITAAQAAKRKRRQYILAGIAAFVVAAAVLIPVGIIHATKKNSQNTVTGGGNTGGGNTGGGNGGSGGGGNRPNSLITGGNGSLVTTEGGGTFTYINNFGGYWYLNANDPFNNNARPNSWTPPLNQSWNWGTSRIYGVNLGGWFVLEPFIAPALFQKYPNAVDEWTLSQAMAADTSSGGGLSQIENHYNTFITEEDIAQIAGAGLNWIRLPIPFWAVGQWPEVGEPFLQRTSWKYILRLFRWARKYGLRINLDLHTIPGSQNGYNHGGKLGQINFMNGIMGYANGQRALDYIRFITEFISQPEYQNLIPMFSIVNEALTATIGMDVISHFYLQSYNTIRSITGIGSGAYITIHDGFLGAPNWAGYMPGADRLALDLHPYIAFNGQPNTGAISTFLPQACNWGPAMNTSQTAFGVTIAGEFSSAINDCGLYVNGVPGTTHSYGGDCSTWQDASQWNAATISGLEQFALASMDALQNWFYWTWKIGNSSTSGRVEAPLWSYQLGLQGGWIPKDPRTASGFCSSIGSGGGASFDGTYPASATGSGPGTVAASFVQSYSAWPPAVVSNVANMALVPTYTPTATVTTLPTDTFTAASKTLSHGNGWANPSDTASAVTMVSGCSYPNPWDSSGVVLPTALCGAGGVTSPAPAGAVTTQAVSASLTTAVTTTAATTTAVATK